MTVLIAAAAATACGGSAQTVSPLGPSSAASIGTLSQTGGTDDVSGPAGGTGSGGGSGHHGSGDDRDDGHRRGEEGSNGGGGTANTPTPGPGSRGVELRGMVANAAGTCPAVTFTIGTQSVVTNAATKFDDGACADIRSGRRVEVKGGRQADGKILASVVELEDADDVDDDEVEGIISGAAGTCPTRTFTLAGKTVATDASTIFEDGVCADVTDGVRAEVKGVLRADRTLLAMRVELKDGAVDDDDEDDDDDRGENRGPRGATEPSNIEITRAH